MPPPDLKCSLLIILHIFAHFLSSIQQWKYVMSVDNLADRALRSLSPLQLESADMWFKCPAFLSAPEEEQSDQPEFVAEWSAQEPDVKTCKNMCCTTKTLDSKDTLLRLFARYSSLVNLQNVTAWIFRWKCCNNAGQPRFGF